MENREKISPTAQALSADPVHFAQTLGRLLRQTPEYESFLRTLKAVNSDLTVQGLAAQMRTHQSALQWNRDDGQHLVELARLEMELENLPVVKEYRQAEAQVQQLFRTVDEIISQEAGVAFAANASRSGCCG